MADTLIAIILAISSAKGSSVICRWPPAPQTSPRLSRPIPDDLYVYDNPWRASHPQAQDEPHKPLRWENNSDYLWHRPSVDRGRSASISHSVSRRNSPAKEAPYEGEDVTDTGPIQDEYDHLLGYSSEYLAGLLCPKRSLCHQKFILKVDDLLFLGHPVCAEAGGLWSFKKERRSFDPRGRDLRKRQVSEDSVFASGVASHDSNSSLPESTLPSWLQAFHVVFVHDLPDPTSPVSGNVQKYFDIIYEQVAFTLTAVLFQEQVLSNFIETECDILGALKDECAGKGRPFEAYMQQALSISSIAPAIKILFESIKSRSLAHITIHNIPLELQLPPYLDSFIQSEDDDELENASYLGTESNSNGNPWGRDMMVAWRLPSLAPWKSLLLLESSEGRDSWADVYENIRGSHVKDEDKLLAEQLIKFLEMADVTLSLADMASLLDWDLETQVFPIVRWLVHHRRAKIVDIVHRGLKTVFTLPLKFEKPLRELSADFSTAFTDPSVPSLLELMAKISQSSSEHFYSAIVQTKEKLALYHDIVQWMLQRDLLVTLHLRIRVVATTELKRRVRRYWGTRSRRRVSWKDIPEDIFALRGRRHAPVRGDEDLKPDGTPRWPSSRRGSTSQPLRSPTDAIEPPILEEGLDFDEELDEKIAEAVAAGDTPERGSREEDDDNQPSIIADPARADIVQRQWLQMMSDGKDDAISRSFDQINRYFDGKCTDDEILFRAEISRKQLREVLHHYEDYLQTFLHPS